MLHVLFASAQLWGSWCFYQLYKKQGRLIAMSEGRLEDPEQAPAVKLEEETDDARSGTISEREETLDRGSEIAPANKHSRIS